MLEAPNSLALACGRALCSDAATSCHPPPDATTRVGHTCCQGPATTPCNCSPLGVTLRTLRLRFCWSGFPAALLERRRRPRGPRSLPPAAGGPPQRAVLLPSRAALPDWIPVRSRPARQKHTVIAEASCKRSPRAAACKIYIPGQVKGADGHHHGCKCEITWPNIDAGIVLFGGHALISSRRSVATMWTGPCVALLHQMASKLCSRYPDAGDAIFKPVASSGARTRRSMWA